MKTSYYKYIISLLILIMSLPLNAQKNYNNWVFGEGSWIKFDNDTDDPYFVEETEINYRNGTASYSDKDGNLLFYSDGVTVWDSTHSIIENGEQIENVDTNSFFEKVFIFPVPTKKNMLYLVTLSHRVFNDSTGKLDGRIDGLGYSIIDYSNGVKNAKVAKKDIEISPLEDDGHGAVITKRPFDENYWLISVSHFSGGVHRFQIFNVDDNGVNLVNHYDDTLRRNITTMSEQGNLEISHNGNYLATIYERKAANQICRFNIYNGDVYDCRVLQDSSFSQSYYFRPRSVQFSPNDKYLYATFTNHSYKFINALSQFDLSNYYNNYNYSTTTIHVDSSTFGDNKSEKYGMQEGPNGKIYVTNYKQDYLGSIENPNKKGLECNFIENKIDLRNTKSLLGLPSTLDIPDVNYKFIDTTICINKELVYYNDDINNSDFWAYKSEIIDNDTLIINSISYENSGYYHLYDKNKELLLLFKVNVVGTDDFIIESNPDSSICIGKELTLILPKKYDSAIWSTGDTSHIVKINEPGIYIAEFSSNNGCYFTDSIKIKDINFEISIEGGPEFCPSERKTLYIDGDYEFYYWSNGSNKDSINIQEEGLYHITVIDSNGCEAYDTINVRFNNPPEIQLNYNPYAFLCANNNVKVYNENHKPDYSYKWSNGSTNDTAVFENPGKYNVVVKNKQTGCKDTVNFEFYESNENFRISKGKNCETNEVYLYPNISHYDSLLWSAGSTEDTLFLEKEGDYWVKVKIGNCELSDTIHAKPIEESDIEIVMIDTANFCELDSVTLLAKTNGEIDSYKWNTGDTDSLIKVGKSGTYSITAYDIYGCELEDKFELTIPKEIPTELDPSGEQTICEGDSFRIEMKLHSSRYSYEWSTGDTTYYTYATEEGEYKVYVTDTKTGCTDSNSIYINVNDFLVPEISGSSFCEGDSVDLTLNYSDDSYNFYWSTGDSTQSITVTDSDEYWVRVWTDNCEGYDTIVVEEFPKPEFDFIGDSVICENLTTELTTDKKFESYQWSTGSTSDTLKNVGVGQYTLTVTDSNGCSTTKSIEVNAEPASLNFENVVYEFGSMDLIELRDTTITVSNNSEKTIEFDYNGVKYVLDPNDEPIELNYKVDTDEVGRYKDTINISMNSPCNKDYKIFINASVYANVTISSAHIHTQIGANIEVPVYLESDVELKPKDLNFTIDINKDFYFTEEPYYYEFKNQIITPQKTEVLSLPGIVLLSEYLETQIKFPDIKFENNYINVKKDPGLISVDSICIHELRQIEVHNPTSLSVYPNPSDDIININIETGESGAFKLKLISSEGREIYNDSWNQNSKDYQSKINTSEIPAGLYQVRVQSPTGIYTKEIIIVK